VKYAVEMGSDSVIYIPNFIKIGSGIRRLVGGDTHTDRQDNLISLLFIFLKVA
jgi:hypothetical protein